MLLLDVWKRFRSAIIRDISRFFVSENCVAMTTRHRLMRKKAPICSHQNNASWHIKIKVTGPDTHNAATGKPEVENSGGLQFEVA